MEKITELHNRSIKPANPKLRRRPQETNGQQQASIDLLKVIQIRNQEGDERQFGGLGRNGYDEGGLGKDWDYFVMSYRSYRRLTLKILICKKGFKRGEKGIVGKKGGKGGQKEEKSGYNKFFPP